ncbi:MAG TPA: enoyl-CoA hydratase-related protein [Burkholderiales bacterium]|nr:enoyl-CoA hydratase-related protein [Burkholderiales bacterium]
MLDVEREGPLARIFLNRPEKANALQSATLEALADAARGLAGDDALRVVVLGGRGKTFCGGADVAELRALNAATAPLFVTRIHEVCQAIRDLPVPVVAKLHGAVIGAGLEIAAACDLRVAAEGTKFAMPEVRLAIPSVVEAALLPRLMGSGRAAWLVLTGQAIDARRGLEWGLIEEIGDGESLVQALLAADPEALRMQKQLLQLWDEAPLATSVAASIERFAQAHSNVPAKVQ